MIMAMFGMQIMGILACILADKMWLRLAEGLAQSQDVDEPHFDRSG